MTETISTLEISASAAERARRGKPVVKIDAHGREIYEPDGQVLTRFVTSNNPIRNPKGFSAVALSVVGLLGAPLLISR